MFALGGGKQCKPNTSDRNKYNKIVYSTSQSRYRCVTFAFVSVNMSISPPMQTGKLVEYGFYYYHSIAAYTETRLEDEVLVLGGAMEVFWWGKHNEYT